MQGVRFWEDHTAAEGGWVKSSPAVNTSLCGCRTCTGTWGLRLEWDGCIQETKSGRKSGERPDKQRAMRV